MRLLYITLYESHVAGTDEVKHICIIGAGPGGLAALKIVTETPQYKSGQWKATVFEEREKVGGVW